MDIKSLSQSLSPSSIEKNAKDAVESINKLTNEKLPTIQNKFNDWGISLDGLFETSTDVLGFANDTLTQLAKKLEDKTSDLSRMFVTAEKGLSIYDTAKDTFANSDSDGFDKTSGGFSIASDSTDLAASWFMSDEDYKEYLDTRNQYMKESNDSWLTGTAKTFDDIADLSGKFMGKQSGMYKTMFAMSKAFSIAKSVMAIKTAISEAAAGPFPANLAAMATVAASTASLVSDIKSVKYTGQAHDGIDYVPREGTWLLDKGERVVDARTNADLKNFLQTNQNGGGQLSINVPVNVNGESGNEDDAKQLAVLIKASIQDTITKEMRPGGLLNRRT